MDTSPRTFLSPPAVESVPASPDDRQEPPGGRAGRGALIAGAALLTVIVVILCLLPKPENDLFFELRIGSDILHSRHLPHADTYSWTERGTRWDVPEWLSFVIFALAFRAGGFFATWLVLVVLTAATAWVVWFPLARRVGAAWAFLLTNLMLLGMSPCLQERPYAFTYLLLAVALGTVARGRAGRPRALLWLVPLCAVWTNLHQGVVVLLGLLLAYALGDAVTAVWLRIRTKPPDLLAPGWEQRLAARETQWRRHTRRAWLMLGTAAACAAAALLSPYGWWVYWNVFITLRDPVLMSGVTEWNSIAVLPLTQMQPFLLLAALSFGALAASRRRNLADAVALAALLVEALLHARNTALFAVACVMIGAPHFESCVQDMRGRLGFPSGSATRTWLQAGFVVLYVATLTLMSGVHLRRAVGPLGYSAEGIGEAVAGVPSYPSSACAFMERERFPAPMRLLNNFEIGGYLMWRLPREPVFVDGRLDVYAGRTFDDMLVLARDGGTPAWTALVRRYGLDCVITTSGRQARAFEAASGWQLVYLDPRAAHHPRCRILLRRGPALEGLIARCLHDRPLQPTAGHGAD